MDYSEHIQHCLQHHPELEILLRRVLQTIKRRNGIIPHQITLGTSDAVDQFDLTQLFTPAAIRQQNGKYIFFPERMSKANIDPKLWLTAATLLIDKSTSSPAADEVTMLLERLSLLFARYEKALQTMRAGARQIKRRLNEYGPDKTRDTYQNAFKALDFLLHNENILTNSDLGIKICNNSKAFRPGTYLNRITTELLAAELDCHVNEVLKRCGLSSSRTTINVTIFGPFIYYRAGQCFDWIKTLWEAGETATLNWSNLDKIERIELVPTALQQLITSENESPFYNMMRKHNSPALLYTAGYPNRAVRKFLSLLDNKINCYHWGDTDPEGIEIATILNNIRPLQLYRCTPAEINRLKDKLQPLDENKTKRLKKMLQNPVLPFRKTAESTLRHKGWLEQEAWQTP